MAEVRLPAESRNQFGKGAARRLRREHKIPAVLYGHGTDPIHLSLPGHDTMMALKTANVLLTLDVDGGQQLALPKHIQRDPIKGTIEHVDLLVVRRDEKVTVEVAVHTVGEPTPGTLVTIDKSTIALEALATAIPTAVEVDLSGLGAGTQILARDLVLPSGATLQEDPESLVLAVSAAVEEPEEEAEAGPEAAASPVAEPERA